MREERRFPEAASPPLLGVGSMAKVSFGNRGKRVRKTVLKGAPAGSRPVGDVVRDIKEGMRKDPGEDYREKSLAIHGLVCARCGKEFDASNRHLLTVHHKDGNHHNNPPDGSNWENLCVYCHDDIHSRELLGEYYEGGTSDRTDTIVHTGDAGSEGTESGLGTLGEKLRKALEEKKKGQKR
jgi:hypothetical protein